MRILKFNNLEILILQQRDTKLGLLSYIYQKANSLQWVIIQFMSLISSAMMHPKSHIDTNFSKVNFTEQTIQNREFINCSFDKCIHTKLTFDACYFEDCTFRDCDLTMIKVKNSTFRDVKFEGSKMLGILWDEAAQPASLSFYKCAIDYSSFFRMSLKKVKILNCQAKEVIFIEANLEHAQFSGTDLEGSIFSNTNLSKANFETAINYSINPFENNVKKAIFSMPDAISLLGSLDIIIKL